MSLAWRWRHMHLIPVLWRQRWVDLFEFEDSLVKRASSRTARTIHRNSVSKEQIIIIYMTPCWGRICRGVIFSKKYGMLISYLGRGSIKLQLLINIFYVKPNCLFTSDPPGSSGTPSSLWWLVHSDLEIGRVPQSRQQNLCLEFHRPPRCFLLSCLHGTYLVYISNLVHTGFIISWTLVCH